MTVTTADGDRVAQVAAEPQQTVASLTQQLEQQVRALPASRRAPEATRLTIC